MTYLAREGYVFEDLVAVATNVGLFLQGRESAQLLEVEALVGTSIGVKSLSVATAARGATPAAGAAALNLLGTGVVFAAADAVTKCRVRYIAQPGVGVSVPKAVGVELDALDKNL